MFKLNYNRCGEFLIPDMGLSVEDRMPLGSTAPCAANTSKRTGPDCLHVCCSADN